MQERKERKTEMWEIQVEEWKQKLQKEEKEWLKK